MSIRKQETQERMVKEKSKYRIFDVHGRKQFEKV